MEQRIEGRPEVGRRSYALRKIITGCTKRTGGLRRSDESERGIDAVALVVALPQRHPRRCHDQVGHLRPRDVPDDRPLGVVVEDEADVDELGSGSDVDEVDDPYLGSGLGP